MTVQDQDIYYPSGNEFHVGHLQSHFDSRGRLPKLRQNRLGELVVRFQPYEKDLDRLI